MSDLFMLSERQMARISTFFPLPHGVPRVDDWRVISGSFTLSSMGCNGRTLPKPMARTRHFTIALSTGACSACLTAFSQHWRRRVASLSGS